MARTAMATPADDGPRVEKRRCTPAPLAEVQAHTPSPEMTRALSEAAATCTRLPAGSPPACRHTRCHDDMLSCTGRSHTRARARTATTRSLAPAPDARVRLCVGGKSRRVHIRTGRWFWMMTPEHTAPPCCCSSSWAPPPSSLLPATRCSTTMGQLSSACCETMLMGGRAGGAGQVPNGRGARAERGAGCVGGGGGDDTCAGDVGAGGMGVVVGAPTARC